MSLYNDIKTLGIEFSHRESDLYIPYNEFTWHLVRARGLSCSRFMNHAKNSLWIEIPFQYEPFWDKCDVAN
jgi:hypothetical protein